MICCIPPRIAERVRFRSLAGATSIWTNKRSSWFLTPRHRRCSSILGDLCWKVNCSFTPVEPVCEVVFLLDGSSLTQVVQGVFAPFLLLSGQAPSYIHIDRLRPRSAKWHSVIGNLPASCHEWSPVTWKTVARLFLRTLAGGRRQVNLRLASKICQDTPDYLQISSPSSNPNFSLFYRQCSSFRRITPFIVCTPP